MQRLLRLLSDPTRLRILLAVEPEELSVNEIADVLGMRQSRISNHLRLLKDAEALRARREGGWTFYRLALGEQPEREALWEAVKRGTRKDSVLRADSARRKAVLDRRRRRSREHFARSGAPIALEHGSLREEVLAALAPQEWVVVDAGCGDGFLTEVLGERFDRVVAVDHSPERLALARRRVRKGAVEFKPGELDALPLDDGATDALFLSMVLHHVPEVGAALREARRVLRPGGRLVIADLAPHHEESVRESLGDLRLGLDPEALANSMRAAGFGGVRILPVRDRLQVGNGTLLDLILVAATRPVRGRRQNKRTKKTKSPNRRTK